MGIPSWLLVSDTGTSPCSGSSVLYAPWLCPGNVLPLFLLHFNSFFAPSDARVLWGEQEIWGTLGTTQVGIITAAHIPPGSWTRLLPALAERGDCCPQALRAAECTSAPLSSLTLKGGHEDDGG